MAERVAYDEYLYRILGKWYSSAGNAFSGSKGYTVQVMSKLHLEPYTYSRTCVAQKLAHPIL